MINVYNFVLNESTASASLGFPAALYEFISIQTKSFHLIAPHHYNYEFTVFVLHCGFASDGQ